MPVNYKPIFDKIMEDPDIIPEEGTEKKDLALHMAIQRANQTINNFKALNLTQDTPKFNKDSLIKELILSFFTKADDDDDILFTDDSGDVTEGSPDINTGPKGQASFDYGGGVTYKKPKHETTNERYS